MLYIFRQREKHSNRCKICKQILSFTKLHKWFINISRYSIFVSFLLYIFFISYLSVRVVDNSFAVGFVTHFWRQAWRLLDLHGDPSVWLLSILLPDLRSHSLLSQVLRLTHVRVDEDHVLHVVDALVPFLLFVIRHRHAFSLRRGGVASSTFWRCLHWRVDVHTLSHWCLHGSYSHRALNWIVHWVERRFLCHVCVAWASLPASHASSLRLQMAGLRLTHFHCFENRVLSTKKYG